MTKMSLKIVAVLLLVLAPVVARAQNTNIGDAAPLAVSGKGKNQLFNGTTNLNTYYKWLTVAGRSYCVETEGAEFDRTPFLNTILTVFRAGAITVIGTNDDADCDISDDCTNYGGSRVCYIAPATEINYARVTPKQGAATADGYYQIRLVESSLYSPWFFSGNGFEAFLLIKNTSSSPRSAVVTLFSPSGAVLATSASLPIPANGSLNLQVSQPAPLGLGLASASGAVRISSDSPLGSLVANVTSLSFGSGVSFDTSATPRPDWASR